jgi:hypothetical protein
MTNAPVKNLARPESTDVRFSIRTLLFVTMPVSLTALVAGQYFRRLNRDQQARVAIAWIAWLSLVVAWILFTAIKRIRVEKRAGPAIIRLPIYGMNPVWRVVNRYLLLGYLYFSGPAILGMIADRAAYSASVTGAFLTAIFPDAIFWAWLMALSVGLWWWGRDVRLCNIGVLWDMRFIRWSEIREQWDPDHDALTLSGLDQRGVKFSCDVVVSVAQRAAVAALLREKVGNQSVQPGSGISMSGKVEQWSAGIQE